MVDENKKNLSNCAVQYAFNAKISAFLRREKLYIFVVPFKKF